MSNKFRFKASGAHLTYKTHIEFDIIEQLLIDLHGPLKWFSFVHEMSDQECPYEHTHAAFQWSAKVPIDLRSCRRFDIGEIHPNIAKFSNKKHMERIYDDYHDKEGVIRRYKSDTSPTSGQTLLEGIRSAPSLAEACALADVSIKTVGDVKLIRDDKTRAPPYVHRYPDTVWKDILPCYGTVSWPLNKALYIWGNTGLAKTQWAVHQGQTPLVVSHMDKLREFRRDDHDLIVFDDMTFNHVPRTMIIHLLDWDEDRQIHCRYSPADIPRNTKKIFTGNKPFAETFEGLEKNCGYDPAILRRVVIYNLQEKAFIPLENTQIEQENLDMPLYNETVRVRFAAQLDDTDTTNNIDFIELAQSP